MAEIKGIDVSRWNGNIDWKTVASYGMGFAILRITEKGNIVDSTFEPNYKGCIENKIPVGVYINTAMLLLLLKLKMKQM